MEKEGFTISVFNIIGVSISRAITRLSDAHLTSSNLALAFAQSKAGGGATVCYCEPCRSVYEAYESLDIDKLKIFQKEFSRHVFVTAISIFDFFLADILKFYLAKNPDGLSGDLAEQRRKRGEAEKYSSFVDWVVRHYLSTHKRRLDFLIEELGIQLDLALISKLLDLIGTRNQIAHHSSSYNIYFHGTHGLWAEPQELVVISWRQSMEALMLIAEVSDAILVEASKKLFGEVPDFRLLTPAVAGAHQSLRNSWDLEPEHYATLVAEFSDSGWSIYRGEGTEAVASNLDLSPLFLISAIRTKDKDLISVKIIGHEYWGRSAFISVDGGKRVAVTGDNSKIIMEKMKRGRWVLVEYYEEPHEEPLFAKFSLQGLSEVWQQYLSRQKIIGAEA